MSNTNSLIDTYDKYWSNAVGAIVGIAEKIAADNAKAYWNDSLPSGNKSYEILTRGSDLDKSFKINKMRNLAKIASVIGLAADAVYIGKKAVDGDYYGAGSAFIGAVSSAALGVTLVALAPVWMPAGAVIVGAVTAAGVFGYFVEDAYKNIFNFFDPLGINEKTNIDFQTAQNVPRYVDPLALDLNGDGIKTVSANSGITFDFDGDGLKTGTGWLNAEDGFLVLDRNNNGTIDNGGELFGVDTVKSDSTLAKNGFDALRDLDTDGNGVFDAYDALFEQVRVWQDKNQDGISQADELKTLTELGISAIHLESNSTNRADNGNRINATGTIDFTDGSTSTAANLELASNPFYREFMDKLQINKAAKALPEMRGSGAVRDLQEAASQSKELASLLKQYSSLQTREKQRALLPKILNAWANSAGYPSLLERLQKAAGEDIAVEFQYSWEKNKKAPNEAQLAQKNLLEKTGILEVFNASDFYTITRRNDGKFTLQAGANFSTVLSTTKDAKGKEKLIITESNLVLDTRQADLLNKSYDSLLNSVYNGLLLQTRLKSYLDAIEFNISEEGIALDYNGIYKKMTRTHAANPVEAIVSSLELQDLLEDPALSSALEGYRSAWISRLDARKIQQLHTLLNDGSFAEFKDGHLIIGTQGGDKKISVIALANSMVVLETINYRYMPIQKTIY